MSIPDEAPTMNLDVSINQNLESPVGKADNVAYKMFPAMYAADVTIPIRRTDPVLAAIHPSIGEKIIWPSGFAETIHP